MSHEKLEAYFAKEQPFKSGIQKLRERVRSTILVESLKWGAPVYTVNNKNVLGIVAFKNHFGLWFFNGVFLSDPLNVLENAQEGKTKAMRHWKFAAIEDIDQAAVLAYIEEAIANQQKGLELKPERKKEIKTPELLSNALAKDIKLKEGYDSLSPGKKREYNEYISSAKQEKTRQSRLDKIIPMIKEGKGLNDNYR